VKTDENCAFNIKNLNSKDATIKKAAIDDLIKFIDDKLTIDIILNDLESENIIQC
jgi:hypothetical protein